MAPPRSPRVRAGRAARRSDGHVSTWSCTDDGSSSAQGREAWPRTQAPAGGGARGAATSRPSHALIPLMSLASRAARSGEPFWGVAPEVRVTPLSVRAPGEAAGEAGWPGGEQRGLGAEFRLCRPRAVLAASPL